MSEARRAGTSALGFGTASLHHLATTRARRAVLDAALESGITHFDTAPLYGFGLAEASLGHFLSANRSRVTVTTKFGLFGPAFAPPWAPVVAAGKIIGRVFPEVVKPREDWSVKRAERSLIDSMKRLRTEFVDFLFLHEPDVRRIDEAALYSWLDGARAAGRIGAWGLAGPARSLFPLVNRNSPLAMYLQTEDTQDGEFAAFCEAAGRFPEFTYGYLKHLPRSATNTDYGDALRGGRLRNMSGCVIFSTRRPDRIRLVCREGTAC